MNFRKKGNFNKPMLNTKHKFGYLVSLIDVSSDTPEYSIGKEQTKTATELAYAEVISYNKKNLAREFQNESRQHNRQQNKTKRREEEI